MWRTRRIAGLWVVVGVGLVGCERSKGGAPGGAMGSAGGGRDAGTDARSEEPTVPPPPPTVKSGGKGDCQTAYAPRPTRDPNPMCKIDGGTFGMGAAEDDPTALLQEKPRRRVTVSPFYLDQFEVTNAQMLHFLNTHGNWCGGTRKHKDECVQLRNRYGTAMIEEYEGSFRLVHPKTAREPFTHASIKGADAYCAWVGKRLPTEAEWEFAARHDPKTGADLRYPWGDEFRANHAACDEGACADGFVDVRDDEGVSVTDYAPVGTFDGTNGRGDGASPWGVHDLAGNGYEMVSDFYVEPYPPCGDCVDPVVDRPVGPKPDRVARTFYGDTATGLPTVLQRNRSSIDGLRCARDLSRARE